MQWNKIKYIRNQLEWEREKWCTIRNWQTLLISGIFVILKMLVTQHIFNSPPQLRVTFVRYMTCRHSHAYNWYALPVWDWDCAVQCSAVELPLPLSDTSSRLHCQIEKRQDRRNLSPFSGGLVFTSHNITPNALHQSSIWISSSADNAVSAHLDWTKWRDRIIRIRSYPQCLRP